MSLIAYLTRIHFADSVVEDALPEEVARLGLRHILLLTDALAGPEGLGERVECLLPVECDVTRADAARPLADLRLLLQDAECDGILAMGGPLVMDRAVELARMPGHAPGPAGREGARNATIPVIAVPTTTAAIGLPDVAVTAKGLLRNDCRPLPSVILCDPTLTLWAGPEVTAAAGMDVIVHCVETYLSTTWNPPADGMALDGLRRAARWIDRAVTAGGDYDARREMMAAALNGALAGQKGLGATHALSQAVEACLAPTAPHGRFHAALLPPVLRFNAPASQTRFTAIAEAMGLPVGRDLAQSLADLGARLGLPVTLAGLGLDATLSNEIAARAAEDVANRTNPRHATAQDYRDLLEAAAI
ncbi:iron-containing alcohol dehydrogenase [Szabonella alba]|uniref:Iron-containing alcohol dehydrogenase n=1 Tax=Szabonella alba TaxID=2804194 RepID=A0A8K0VBT4_9RHOB|nr:iron-containing alcohol dehydrogenase [Szabonella alba]MBL4918081.1 iron-containing alcohol dehydrogenase [Szabonella alba]